MSTIRAQRDLREGESTAPLSAHFVAMKSFAYGERKTGATVAVARGEKVDAATLRLNGCNLEKLRATGFLRRADEQ